MAKEGCTQQVWSYLRNVGEQISRAINKEQSLIKERKTLESEMVECENGSRKQRELKADWYDNKMVIEKSRHIQKSGTDELVRVIDGGEDGKLWDDLPERWRAPAFKPKVKVSDKADVPGQQGLDGGEIEPRTTANQDGSDD